MLPWTHGRVADRVPNVAENDSGTSRLARPVAFGLLVALLLFAFGELLIHLEQARDAAALRTGLQSATVSLRVIDAEGVVRQGGGEAFADADAVVLDLPAAAMPEGDGRWQLALVPAARTTGITPRLLFWHVLAVLLALGVGLLTLLALREPPRPATASDRDELTGLPGRDQFLLQAEVILALAQRQEFPFTVVDLDIEGLQRINDEIGRDAGDALLRHVAQQLRSCLRASDLIARLGDDDFLLLLPGIEPGPVLDTLLERLRETVATPLPWPGQPLSVDLSAGVSCYPADGFTLEDLLRIADFNRHADKRNRRQAA